MASIATLLKATVFYPIYPEQSWFKLAYYQSKIYHSSLKGRQIISVPKVIKCLDIEYPSAE